MSRAPELHRAYLATRYRILTAEADRPLDMRIGEHNARLDQTLHQHKVQQGAFLTACNPYSQPLDGHENQARMEALRCALSIEGWRWWPGLGIPEASDWSPEDSVFVLHMDRPTACSWGHRYAQNALVYVSAGSAPELVWLVD